MRCSWFLVLCAAGVVLCIEHDLKGFDDSILFGINWPGAHSNDPLDNIIDGDVSQMQEVPDNSGKEILKVTTAQKEKYECRIPELLFYHENSNIANYDGPSPIHLLKPLITQKICSYRLESYWSYEVCHGRYVRQYHEDREGKNIKTQEYYLGLWGIGKLMSFEAAAEAETQDADGEKKPLKTTKVEGMSLPYVEMKMDEGTICDLNGKPRVTRVRYVCYTHGKHEVYSFKETATCEYEVIILSSLLCAHPQFKPKEMSENVIDCIPIGGAPKRPRALLQQEIESEKNQQQSIRLLGGDNGPMDKIAIFKVEKIEKDGETHLKFELRPLEDDTVVSESTTQQSDTTSVTDSEYNYKSLPVVYDKTPVISDDSPVRAFLNGENCLNGGTGWWKYEFCYGKHVIQYHVGRNGDKTTLNLGQYDEDAHLQWIRENKGKAPRPVGERTHISHFYSNGDVCDKTGKPRQTEVKLKCTENSSNPAQVTLYLLEPRTCHYILGVESPLICEILPLADKNGLISPLKPLSENAEDTEFVKVEDESAEKKLPKFGHN